MQITLSVVFNGTGHAVDMPKDDYVPLGNGLISLMEHSETGSQRVMAFDGIGVHRPIMGTLFGTGMDKDCDDVIQVIEKLISEGHTVKLNAYGHSRGAVSALMLAKQLSFINPKQLEINLALHDPVPGNLITTGLVDPFEISLAQKTMDLSGCKPLKDVLVLYPHQPLPGIYCHAPMFVVYPEGLKNKIREEVIPGCHAGAQWQYGDPEKPVFANPASFIAFDRIHHFLDKHGTSIKPLKNLNFRGLPPDDMQYEDALRIAYDLENKQFSGAINREAHSKAGKYIKTKENASYFNTQHQALNDALINETQVRTTIEESGQGIHPTIGYILKGITLGLGAAGLLFFTTSIGALPALALGLAIAAFCFSPMTQWGIDRFFYPHFKMRQFGEPLDSPEPIPCYQ